MNKLMGFYELKALGIPTVKWEEFLDSTSLSQDVLWTVRTALLRGNDYNLPRVVGVTRDRAEDEARKLKELIKNDGMVIYYPYFIAEKSGTVKICSSQVVIEAVSKDLWNLVTHGLRDVTMIFRENGTEFSGDGEFLTHGEVAELQKYIRLLRGKYREDINAGKELYLEWSFAYNSSVEGKPQGEKYLVFYEMRII